MKDRSTDITKEGTAPLKGIRGTDLYDSSQMRNEALAVYNRSAANAAKAYRGDIGYEVFSDPKLFTPEESNLTLGQSTYDPAMMLNPTEEKISNARADNQPWYLQLGAGIAKGVSLAATTFLDGTVGLAVGMIDAINRGEWAGLWDNPFSRAMKDWNDMMEDQLTNYYSTEELNNPWYKNILSANWLGDKLIKNLGFTVGAYYSGKVFAAPLKLVGAGGKVGAGVHGLSSAVNEGRIEALNNSTDWYNLHKLQLDDQKQQLLNEAFAELEDTKGNLIGDKEHGYRDPAYDKYNEAVNKIENDYNATLARLERDRKRMGNADLAMNIPILTASNIVQFGKLMGRGFKTNKRISGELKGSKLPKSKAEGALRESKPIGVKGSAKTGYKAEMSSLAAKTGGIRGALSEGAEEMAQSVASTTAGNYYATDVNNFYKSRIDPEAEQETLSWVKSFGSAIAETVGNGDSWEEFFIGALTGALGMPHFSKKGIKLENNIFSNWREAHKERTEQMAMADKMNEIIQSPDRLNKYQSTIRRTKYQNMADEALENNDQFSYENATHAQLVSDIALFKRAGKEADLIDLIENSLDISDENLQAIIENTTTETADGKKVGPWIDSNGNPITNTQEGKQKMIDTLKQNKEDYISLVKEYSTSLDNLESYTKGRLNEDQLEELAWMDTQINNWVKRSESMSGEIKDIIGRITNQYREYIEVLTSVRDREGASHKEKTPLYDKYDSSLRVNQENYDILNNLASMSPGAFTSVLTSKDNAGVVNTLIKEIEGLDDPSFSKPEREEAVAKLKDLQKIGEAIETYSNKFNEYLADPQKQLEDQQKAVEDVAKATVEKEKGNIRDRLAQAKSIREFSDILGKEENQELANSVASTLREEGNEVAKNHYEVTQYDNELRNALQSSSASAEAQQDALQLWDKQMERAEDLNQVSNMNSLAITDEKAFTDTIEDQGTASTRFQNAKYALQQAMSEVNKSIKFKNRFAPEAKQPEKAPKGKGTSSDTTGDSGTTTVPHANPISSESTDKKVDRENSTVDKDNPPVPTGDISAEDVAEENKKLNDRSVDSSEFDKQNKGQKRYYRPAIPEIQIDAAKEGDFRPFDIVVKEKQGKDFSKIYSYLQKEGAFDYVNSGRLKAEEPLFFMIDPEFEATVENEKWHTAPTVFITTKDGQVVGSLDEGASTARFTGLDNLLEKVRKEYADSRKPEDNAPPIERFTATPQTKVSQIMIGKVPYTSEDRSLNDIPGAKDKPIFGIIKSGSLDTNGKLDDSLVIKPVDVADKEGRLYLLIPNAAGTYSPVAVRVKHFNAQEFNPNDATVASTNACESIVGAIERLATSDSDEDVTKVVTELSEYLYLGKGLPAERDINISWFDAAAGSGIVISKKLKNPDGSYITYEENGTTRIKEDHVSVYFQTNKKNIQHESIPGIHIDVGAAKNAGMDVSSAGQPRSTEDIKNDIINVLLKFNPPLQVRLSNINKGTYNTDIIESNILTSNIREAKVISNWFTMDYFDNQGNLQKAVNPPSAKPAPTRRRAPSPVGGKEGTVEGTAVTFNGKSYIVDVKAGTYKDGSGRTFDRITGSPNVFDMAWAQETYGDATEGLYMTENKVITPDDKVLNRNTGAYLPESLAKQIKDKIAGRAQSVEAKVKQSKQILVDIDENQKKVDKSKTDNENYYILEEDGEYHSYSRVHTKLGDNWLGEKRETNNSKRALAAGSAVDRVVRDFFNNNTVEKPAELSEEAFRSLLNRLAEIKANINKEKETFFANNIVLFQKYPDGTRVAGEVDILAVTRNGDFKIYDTKTSGKSFSGEYFNTKSSMQRISTKDYYTLQLSAYQNLFESQYGIKPISLGILPFVLTYNTDNTVATLTSEQGIPITYNPSVPVPLANTVKASAQTPSTTAKTEAKKDTQLPILDSSLEVMNPVNRIIPENAFEDGEGQIGYYDLDGTLYTGYIKKIGEVEVTLASGEKANYPIHVTKKRNKVTDVSGNEAGYGNTSEYYTVLQNGKAMYSGDYASDEGMFEAIMNEMKAHPQEVAKFSNEATKVYNPSAASKATTETGNNGAQEMVAKESAANKGNIRRRRHKLRAIDSRREVWNEQKELEWLDKVLPQLSREDRVKVVKGLIQVAENGPVAWGMFSDGIVTLSDIAAEGTAYHEAFHVVFNLLLNQEERANLFSEARQLYGNKSLEDLEEDMAEGFREYVMSRDSRGLGRKILDFFRDLFAKVTNWKYVKPSLYSYYRMIDQGAYSKSRLSDNLPTNTNDDIRYRTIDINSLESLIDFEYNNAKEKIKNLNNRRFNTKEEALATFNNSGINKDLFYRITGKNANNSIGYKIQLLTKDAFEKYKDSILTEQDYYNEKKEENRYFDSLDPDIQTRLLNKGWTKEIFDSVSQQERDNAVNCISF